MNFNRRILVWKSEFVPPVISCHLLLTAGGKNFVELNFSTANTETLVKCKEMMESWEKEREISAVALLSRFTQEKGSSCLKFKQPVSDTVEVNQWELLKCG